MQEGGALQRANAPQRRRLTPSPVHTTTTNPRVLLDWEAGYAAQHDEAKYELSEIEGTVPMALRNGTLFRNGPGKFGEAPNPYGR